MELLKDVDHLDTSDIFFPNTHAPTPAGLKNFITLSDSIISVTSDLTGQKEISIFLNGQTIIVSDNLNKLVRFISENTQEKLTLRTESISHLLHDAIIPSPYTVYNEIFSLAIGNSIAIDMHTGNYEIHDNYPYLRSLSTQDSQSSIETLLQLMSDSLEQGTRNTEPLLMLSSGKDSVSLAIACGELDLRCKAVTYKSNESDKESEIAKNIAKKFGLDHEVISIDHTKSENVEELMTNFFRRSIHPCVDFSQIGYLQTLAQLSVNGKTIIDGTGNDSYFGGVPCKTDHLKYRFTIGNSKIADRIKPFIRHSSKISYLLRSDAEINFATRTFRYPDSSQWFSNSLNTSDYWRNRNNRREIKNKAELETYFINCEAHIRGRDYDRSCSFLKTRLAVDFAGAQVYYPYCNDKLIDYCFNLPEKYRFSMKLHMNKILLRKMLNEIIQYDSLTKTKFGFNFDGRTFINLHQSFIKHEILNCKLWEHDKMQDYINHALKLLINNYYESHGIIILFLLSGWVNHNQYLSE